MASGLLRVSGTLSVSNALSRLLGFFACSLFPVFASVSTSSLARGETVPVSPKGPSVFKSSLHWNEVDSLLLHYNENSWALVTDDAKRILGSVRPDSAGSPWRLDIDYVSLVVVAPGTDGTPQLVRVLVNQREKTQPYTSQLRGDRSGKARRLYEVLLAPTAAATIASMYTIEMTSSPISEQFSAYLKGSLDLKALASRLQDATKALPDTARRESGELWMIASWIPVPSRLLKNGVG